MSILQSVVRDFPDTVQSLRVGKPGAIVEKNFFRPERGDFGSLISKSKAEVTMSANRKDFVSWKNLVEVSTFWVVGFIAGITKDGYPLHFAIVSEAN